MSEPMEYRAFQLSKVDTEGDGRTVFGRAVSFEERSLLPDGTYERYVPGVFRDSKNVILKAEHDRSALGKVTFRETADGVYIEARISDTTEGRDALTLIKDQVYDGLSIGFLPQERSFDDDGTVVHTRAHLFEVSLTGIPVSQGTTLSLRDASGIQESETTMPDTDLAELKASVNELRVTQEDIQRNLQTRAVAMPTESVLGAEYRSAGEWLKAFGNHEEPAVKLMQTRAFTGTQMADGVKKVPWLDDAIRIAAVNSVAVGSFRNAPLPATGLSANYLKFGSSTIQVQQQVNEGDVLAFGKLNLDTASTNIKWYGGYSTLSYQVIQRADIDVLNTTFTLLTAEAAKRSNAAFIADLVAANASYQTVAVAAPNNFDAWMDAFIDAQIALNNTGLGLPAEGVLVSTDVFRKMLKITDSTGNARLMNLPGVNYGALRTNAGTASLPGNGGGLVGSAAGFEVKVDAALPNGTMYVYNSNAAVVLGDRTPTRLGPDDDIARLTTEVSVYFAQASAVQFPSGIVKITVP